MIRIRRIARNIGSNFLEIKMGKLKAWLMQLEDDALYMTREEFLEAHGEFNIGVWTRVQACKELEQLGVDDGKIYKLSQEMA